MHYVLPISILPIGFSFIVTVLRSVLLIVCISLWTQCSTHYPGQYYPVCVLPYQHNAARITQGSITHCVYFLVITAVQHTLPKSVLPIVCTSLWTQCSTHYPSQYYWLFVFPLLSRCSTYYRSVTQCVFLFIVTVLHVLPKSVLPIMCISSSSQCRP